MIEQPHTHSTNRANQAERWVYNIPDLWRAAEHLPIMITYPTHLPEFHFLMDTSVANIWWSRQQGTTGSFTMKEMITHTQQILDADLDFPIILNPEGGIMDGIHRVLKAVLLGKTIKVQRFEEWPEPTTKESYNG